MSRFLTSMKNGTYLEEIESMEECKWRINDVCCNENSEFLGDYYCEAKKNRKCFEKEDGIIKDFNMKYISKKDYLEKIENSVVGYALYVQDTIKKNDYVRLNTGNIVKVICIRENKVNKKAIYYGIYEQDWFNSIAVENFSDNIINLIEEKDIVEIELSEEFVEKKDKKKLIQIGDVYTKETLRKDIDNGIITRILTILSYNQYMANCYKVGGKDE